MNDMHTCYIHALRSELITALGCTEPIAIAYAAAKAGEVLGRFPERMEIRCSGNIIKNVKSVDIPHSHGLRGVEAAAVLGVVGGKSELELEVLSTVTPEDVEKAKSLLAADFITCKLQHGVSNLYIVASVYAAGHEAHVTVINRHINISCIELDGRIIYRQQEEETSLPTATDHKDDWSIRSIIDFADTVDIDEIKDLLQSQLDKNTAIAVHGLSNAYGGQVGRILLESYGNTVRTRARAKAAAGSDARMGGCSLPVVINSGSGNQGMTVSLPVAEYAREMNVSQEKLYRSLLVSNLVSIYQKHFIGNLSAFCGAVTAAAGAGAGITYLHCGTYEQICHTIINTVANVGGIICDGAKASCAAKIASAVDAAILGHEMSMRGLYFHSGDGIVGEDIEETIRSAGYIGKVGMRDTDAVVLDVMMGNAPVGK